MRKIKMGFGMIVYCHVTSFLAMTESVIRTSSSRGGHEPDVAIHKKSNRLCGLALMVCLTGILLTGCSIFPSYEPVDSYAIVPKFDSGVKASKLSSIVLVDRPTVDSFIDSDQIPVFFDKNGRRDYLSNAKFDANLADKIQSLTIMCFTKSGAFEGVARVDSGMIADYMLQMTINDLSLHYGDDNRAYIKLSANVIMIDMKTRKPTVTQFVSGEQLVSNNITDVMDGFNNAAAALIESSLDKIYSDLKSRPQK